MAVTIKCPKCGKEGIPSTEERCPECGFETKKYIIEAFSEINDASEGKANLPSKPSLLMVIIDIAVLALAAFFIVSGFNMSPLTGWLGFVIIGVVIGAIGVGITKGLLNALDKYRLARTDYEAYQKLIEEETKARAENFQKVQEQKQQQEEDRLSKLPACPVCGSKDNVKRIGTLNRAASVTAWGLASSKIGKQYECTHCGHKW